MWEHKCSRQLQSLEFWRSGWRMLIFQGGKKCAINVEDANKDLEGQWDSRAFRWRGPTMVLMCYKQKTLYFPWRCIIMERNLWNLFFKRCFLVNYSLIIVKIHHTVKTQSLFGTVTASANGRHYFCIPATKQHVASQPGLTPRQHNITEGDRCSERIWLNQVMKQSFVSRAVKSQMQVLVGVFLSASLNAHLGFDGSLCKWVLIFSLFLSCVSVTLSTLVPVWCETERCHCSF